MKRTLQMRVEETTVAVETEADGRVTIDGVVYIVDDIGPGIYRVGDGVRHWTVAVAGPADDRWISVDGQVSRVEVATGATAGRRKRRSGGADALSAPMPATVVKLLVEPGATVKQGDTLVVLEAMKMELPVRAPRDGVVRHVRCRAGELVQPGVALLELD